MNNYRNFRINIPEQPRDLVEIDQPTMDDGFRGDLMPGVIPLGASPELSDVRFERGGIRKDFGWSRVGNAASSRILGLIEHKFIEDGQTFQRLVRITRTAAGNCQLEVWDSATATWIVDTTSTETIRDVLLSTISIQGQLLIADGQQILARSETRPLIAASNDFTPGNSIGVVGESATAILSPAGAVAGEYEINYSVDITLNTGTELTLVLSFKHEGVEFATRSYHVAAGSASWNHETLLAELEAADGDEIAIEIKSIDVTGINRSSAFVFQGHNETLQWRAVKSFAAEAVNDLYYLNFELRVEDGHEVTLGFYYDDGINAIKHGELTYGPGVWRNAYEMLLDGATLSYRFGISVESATGGALSYSLIPSNVTWTEADVDIAVHGFNEETDADAAAGVEYQIEGADAGTFGLISADAPAARYLASFGDRVLALHDDGDKQALSWSADGDITTWAGDDTGTIFLVDARIDPIDDLMALAPLGSNFAVLLRKRSIMRVFETGNIVQSIGAVHWIEGIGTESPFSPTTVPGGVIFLGHDYQVYYLTENGPVPVGGPVQQTLIETVPANLHLVDATYDPVFGEYWLGIPENGASNITAAWIFDFKHFRETQQLRWRKRSLSAWRLATASKV